MDDLLYRLTLYNNINADEAVGALCEAFEYAEHMQESEEEISAMDISFLNERVAFAVNRIIDRAEKLGISGNIWKKYLIDLFIRDENPLSLHAERKKINKSDSIAVIAAEDMTLFKKLYGYDFSRLEKLLDVKHFATLADYKCIENKQEDDSISSLIDDTFDKIEKAVNKKTLLNVFLDIYKNYGSGSFGFNNAFRIMEDEDSFALVPVTTDESISFDDIIGYDLQKNRLKRNTISFCRGKRSNDVLLYGDNGTGKSTSIKATLNEYKGLGLRLVELNKYQFRLLPELMSYLKNRNYRFIIFIDDLSFEEDEIEYKFLKSAIEGGIESRPDNVLIYATSNRRHLIKEMWDDRKDMEHEGEIHRSDTLEEKISLSSRFGETINFSRPDKKEYEEIVLALAEKEGIKIDRDLLLREADRWELRHGGFTGRVARQFINYISSQEEKK